MLSYCCCPSHNHCYSVFDGYVFVSNLQLFPKQSFQNVLFSIIRVPNKVPPTVYGRIMCNDVLGNKCFLESHLEGDTNTF